MTSGISTLWTKNLQNEADKVKFRESVINSSNVMKRLAEILTEKINAREVFKEEDYKNPSWAYQQADRNGYVRALLEINQLLRGIDQ